MRLDMVGTAGNTTFVDTVRAGMQAAQACADPLLRKPRFGAGMLSGRRQAMIHMPHSQPHLKMSSWHLNMHQVSGV